LQPKKKEKGPVHGWGLSENVWEREGGGVVRAKLDNYVANISEMLPPRHTSDFEPCMHKYLQQLLPKHLEMKPMKRKEK
jgi:hypothetical protein